MDIEEAIEILELKNRYYTVKHLSLSLLNKQRKLLSLKNHPDVGGDINKQKKINEAYEIIKSRITNNNKINRIFNDTFSEIFGDESIIINSIFEIILEDMNNED